MLGLNLAAPTEIRYFFPRAKKVNPHLHTAYGKGEKVPSHCWLIKNVIIKLSNVVCDVGVRVTVPCQTVRAKLTKNNGSAR